MNDAVIVTNPARCRDCYRCVRSCEVKAIRVREGQAQVVPELCIVCGMCVRVCPQKAKDVHIATPDVKQALREGRRLIASVAPSAPAYFNMGSFTDMEEALKKLGFYAAEETAVGAQIVGLAHQNEVEKSTDRRPIITSSCPAIVNLIEKYHPDLIPHLAPIVSPMIAHGRILAKNYGPEAYIVFIGPCIAKKLEILDEDVAGTIHAVMTFKGLQEWFTEVGVRLSGLTPIKKSVTPVAARLFPIEGGLISTARMNTDVLSREMIIATGLEACQDLIRDIRSGQLSGIHLVELMACKGGCINGPVMADVPGGIFLARRRIIDYQMNQSPYETISREAWPPLVRSYHDKKKNIPEFSEEQIQEVLQRVNKYSPDDELNCGACGYSSCREKAVATLRGMAEVTMCIPYMRHRSESLRQVVMDVSPNAILIIDETLVIQDMSPSAEHLFGCSLMDMKGQHLSHLIIALDDFVQVRDTGCPIISKVCRLREDLVTEQSIVRVEGQTLIVAIMRDITEQERERKTFQALRAETLEQTQEVVRKQMRVAHQIAHLLGETTAESKMIVSHLAKLLEKEVTE
ncbi:MAG: [Fe-Fe] hydrogenase large subunit C-terminal domain-containing protein [Syntrophales bacterium]|nr:[Fe-Fe] hydrogenase large subunit C-terminal domain-containing protein [Syntrophales bacterium]